MAAQTQCSEEQHSGALAAQTSAAMAGREHDLEEQHDAEWQSAQTRELQMEEAEQSELLKAVKALQKALNKQADILEELCIKAAQTEKAAHFLERRQDSAAALPADVWRHYKQMQTVQSKSQDKALPVQERQNAKQRWREYRKEQTSMLGRHSCWEAVQFWACPDLYFSQRGFRDD
jgi:hypothetical protein